MQEKGRVSHEYGQERSALYRLLAEKNNYT